MLCNSENNDDIVRMVRGEGRKEILDEIVSQLSNIIDQGSHEDCRYAKDFICEILHTSGNKEFKNYTAFVSTFYG